MPYFANNNYLLNLTAHFASKLLIAFILYKIVLVQALSVKVIMPRCACASEVYGSTVFVCVCVCVCVSVSVCLSV